MKTEDVKDIYIRKINNMVFVHLKNGKEVIRYFDWFDFRDAKRVFWESGEAAQIEFVVNLINTKYPKYESPKFVYPTYEDERYFYLKHLEDSGLSMTGEEEEEYLNLEYGDLLPCEIINAKR